MIKSLKNANGDVKIYNSENNEINPEFAQKIITKYLKKYNFVIRGLRLSDLQDLDYEKLCLDEPALSDLMSMIVDDLKEIKEIEKDSKEDIDLTEIVTLLNEHRFTFVVLKESEVVSMSATVFNKDGLYFEISCTRPGNVGSGTNYFIRAYAILEILKNKKIEKIYGTMAGRDMKKLKEYHEKRGCVVVEENKYECEISRYLNIFFANINNCSFTHL